MREVIISVSVTYRALTGNGLLSELGERVFGNVGNRRYCVISDDNVAPIYMSRALESLSKAGLDACSYVFPSGEKHKTLETVAGILDFLAKEHFTRSDALIALGGGIVGDVTGFVSSVYQRGIRFVSVPTTVLSAVDSSVGGKTGVNLGGLKNQVGTFWQPSLVLCDPETFRTLPSEQFASGMAEVIKYAALFSEKFGDRLLSDFNTEDVIAECIEFKRRVVSEDERDTGVRQLLNLGHTFGHAVEKISDNYYCHGQAVDIGMVMAFKAAVKLGVCPAGETEKLTALLTKFGLPLTAGFSEKEMLDAMQSDKKRLGGRISLVLPHRFGECFLYETDMSQLPSIVAAAL